jgi:hypothetical protein
MKEIRNEIVPATIYVMDKKSFLEPKKLDWERTKYFFVPNFDTL